VTISPLDAYTLLRFAEDFRQRLFQAEGFLADRRGLSDEKAWLRTALERVENACSDVPAVLERANQLPELASVRDEYAWQFQGVYVDALEKLLAGITFHVSARAPIIEALFPQTKLPALRRAAREQVERYGREFEKRAKGSYVTRMVAQPEFAFLPQVLEQVGAAYAKWESSFADASLSAEEVAALTERLSTSAQNVELAVVQARLLAEAAMAPIPGAFEEHGLNAKPKKRAPKAAAVKENSTDGALPDEEVAAAAPAEPEPVPEAGQTDPAPVRKRSAGSRARPA